MQQHKATHHRCSDGSKDYLQCRMDRGLMREEDLETMGYAAEKRVKASEMPKLVHDEHASESWQLPNEPVRAWLARRGTPAADKRACSLVSLPVPAHLSQVENGLLDCKPETGYASARQCSAGEA